MTPASQLLLVEAKHLDIVTMSLRHGLEEAAVIGAIHCVGKIARKGVACAPFSLLATTVIALAHDECHFGKLQHSRFLTMFARINRRVGAGVHLRNPLPRPSPTEQRALFRPLSQFRVARMTVLY